MRARETGTPIAARADSTPARRRGKVWTRPGGRRSLAGALKGPTPQELERALRAAVEAARAAGALLRRHWRAAKRVQAASQHDLKLELDLRCQRLIERRLRALFPDWGILGEEQSVAAADAGPRWVVDPIDGTVNFAYGIPHACVSIALETPDEHGRLRPEVAAVFDPFCEELWTARRGQPARLNGRAIRVSDRARLAEAIVSIGAGRRPAARRHLVETLATLVHRVRKLRSMGSAALALAYVAGGRFDAYVEVGLNWWDIAAGGLLVECAGGRFEAREQPGTGYDLVAHNGRIGARLRRFLPETNTGAAIPKVSGRRAP